MPSCGTAVADAVTADGRTNTKYIQSLVSHPPKGKEKATPLRSPGPAWAGLAVRLVLFTISLQSFPRLALKHLKGKLCANAQCSAYLTTCLETMAHYMGCSFYPAPVLNLYPYFVLVTFSLNNGATAKSLVVKGNLSRRYVGRKKLEKSMW